MEPYYDQSGITIHHNDCREALPDLKADVIVTDPPYGLAFMGKAWDQVDQQFHQAWATAALDALPPGGWLLAFGGTRTWHRLACGIEDAGFEMRDTLIWLYGQGWPKSKMALKPGWEPVLMARKPGPSALQIDDCRIETMLGGGRWPANVLLDEETAELVDQQSGVSRSTDRTIAVKSRGGILNGTGELRATDGTGYGDLGGASRFFYTAKAGPAERVKVDGEQHPTVKPLALMRWLVRLVTPPNGLVLDPFCGSGSTLVAARLEGRKAIGIEADERWCKGSAHRLQEQTQEVLALG